MTFGHDSGLFPEEITFGAPATGETAGSGQAGRAAYRGHAGPGQPFIVWDAGTYAVEGDRLTISLANDDLASYPIIREPDSFTVIDETGGRTTYRRVTPD